MTPNRAGSLPDCDDEGRVSGWEVGEPGALEGTLAELLGAGMEPARVLPCFTANVARVLGLAAKGRIAVGTDADLVVLDDDGRADDVMARGRWHVRDGRQVIHGAFERGTE